MANLEPSNRAVNLIEKKPLAYLLCVVLIICGWLLTKVLSQNDNPGRLQDCKSQVIELTKRVKALEDRNDALTMIVTDQSRSFERLKFNTDSLIRATIGKKAKQLKTK